MPLTLSWKNLGPVATPSVAAPPVGSVISTYVLDVEPQTGRVLYLVEPDDDTRGSELWAFEQEWKNLTAKRVSRLEHLEGGGYDPTRQGLVAFGFDFEHEGRRWAPRAMVVGTDGRERRLTFTGEFPLTESDDATISTFDARAAFAFDPTRSVWVCFTRLGIWELDASDAWTRKWTNDGTMPKAWSKSTGLACFDAVKRQPFFWCQTEDDDGYPAVGFHWDGARLVPASMEGLPELTHGLFNPSFQVGPHAKHGLVLQVEGQLFAPSARGWSALPVKGDGPPRMESALLVHEPKRDALFVGPGQHHQKGSAFQRMVFVFSGGEWSTQGTLVSPSELKKSGYGKSLQAHGAGQWLATSTHSLRTWVREADAWRELVTEKQGEAVLGRHMLDLVGGPRVVAINEKGGVAEFDGAKWKVLLAASPIFKERRGWAGAWDGAGRLVVWGGEVKNRKSNDTLFFEGGAWRAVKKPSPQPADFKHGKDGTYVDTHLLWDGALGRLLRFGFEDVAMLGDDEVWATLKVKGYTASITSRGYGHIPVHDAKTGQTLLVDLTSARVVRFDLSGCAEVATFTWPEALRPKKQHDRPAWAAFDETWSWDATTRTLLGVNLEDAREVFALDLGPAFEAAAALGPRTGAAQPKAGAVAPRAEKQVLYRVKKGAVETVAVAAGQEKAGFVPASKLDGAALAAMVGVPSEPLSVGRASKGKAAPPPSRVGGPAPAVAGKKWPKLGKRPMGFLLQVETGTLLEKHAGVAVFCALDGEATNEEDHNRVLLLTAAELKKTVAPPEGVPALPVQPITFKAPKVEVDERRALAFGEKDPAFLPVLEKFQGSKLVHPEGLSQKRGGLPVWLQGGDGAPKGYTLVAQVDFDHLDVSKAWPEAGLSGCVYVFVKDDERDAFAMWQYT